MGTTTTTILSEKHPEEKWQFSSQRANNLSLEVPRAPTIQKHKLPHYTHKIYIINKHIQSFYNPIHWSDTSNGSLVIQLNRFWKIKDITGKELLYSRRVKEAGIYQTHKDFNTMFLVIDRGNVFKSNAKGCGLAQRHTILSHTIIS